MSTMFPGDVDTAGLGTISRTAFWEYLFASALLKFSQFSAGLSGKELACKWRRSGLIPGSGKSSGGRNGNPFHGQRSLGGYSPWSCKKVGHNWVTKQQQQLGSWGASTLLSADLLLLIRARNWLELSLTFPNGENNLPLRINTNGTKGWL